MEHGIGRQKPHKQYLVDTNDTIKETIGIIY